MGERGGGCGGQSGICQHRPSQTRPHSIWYAVLQAAGSKYDECILGQLYGVKDANQERGYSVEYVAQNIIKCLLTGNQQLILAPFYVRMAVLLRAFLPTIYFYIMARRFKNEKNKN